MKRSVRDRWLAALRSDKYLQGQNYLQYQTADGKIRYCCLGVLCEIVDVKPVKFGVISAIFQDHDAEDLPMLAAQRAGLNQRDPFIHLAQMGWHSPNEDTGIAPEGYTLANLNDSGLPFPQIADVIEFFIPGEED